MTIPTINVLGRFELRDPDGNLVTVPGAKQQALLAYLALNRNNPPTRDRLMSLFWGDRFDEQARQSLRQALSKLRKIVGDDDFLIADGDRVGIRPDRVTVDVDRFEALAGEATDSALEEAADLWREALLEGLTVREPAFEEWLEAERSRLASRAVEVLEQTAAQKATSGDQVAVAILRKALSIDPFRESAHRLLIQALAASGQRAAAIKHFESLQKLLADELGVEPESATREAVAAVRAAAPEDVVRSAPKVSHQAPFAPSVMPGIAVAPFADLSADRTGASLADGITQDIISALTRYRWLSVMASQAGSDADIRVRAAERGASYVIEGTVQVSGERLRVTARLVALDSGRYIWVQRYDRTIADIFEIQDEITETIAGTIEPELAAAEAKRARERGEDNLTAFDAYHLGLAAQYEFSQESNLEAQRLFRLAIDLDPGFAAAYARLAYALVISTIYFEAKPVDEILDQALDLAKQATRLDDQDAIAHFALGRAYLALGEYESSVIELEAAIALNPSLAQAHCALGDSLAYAGRLSESVPEFEEAVRLSPHDPYRWAFLTYGAVAYLFMKDHETAAKWAQEAVRVPNSHYGANAALATALGHLGRDDEAKAAVAELLRRRADFTCSLARERLFYLRAPEQVEHYIEGLRRAGLPE